ncbi:hypothetical protein Chor_010413 [Crotalus horridus]
MKLAASLLMDTRESLKKEIRDLTVKVSNLEAENPDIVKIMEMFRELEDTRATLEVQNQTLTQTNKVLHCKIRKVSNNLVRFQASKASRDQDILRMKQEVENIAADVKRVEAKMETAKQRYEEKKQQSARLERMMVELEGICKAQDSEILFLEEHLGPPMRNTLFSVLSGGTWVLVALIAGLGFSNPLPFLVNSW